MKQLFVPYEIALIAKAKGFDEPCIGIYNPQSFELCIIGKKDYNSTSYPLAPLYQQLIDWFREKHKINVQPMQVWSGSYMKYYATLVSLKKSDYTSHIEHTDKLDYYEALNKALEEAFKLI